MRVRLAASICPGCSALFWTKTYATTARPEEVEAGLAGDCNDIARKSDNTQTGGAANLRKRIIVNSLRWQEKLSGARFRHARFTLNAGSRWSWSNCPSLKRDLHA